MKVKVALSCLTLCDPMDYVVHGIFQARILEWVAFSFSRRSSQPRDCTLVLPYCRQILYQLNHKGNPLLVIEFLFHLTVWLPGRKTTFPSPSFYSVPLWLQSSQPYGRGSDAWNLRFLSLKNSNYALSLIFFPSHCLPVDVSVKAKYHHSA